MEGGAAPSGIPSWQGGGKGYVSWDDWGKPNTVPKRYEYNPVGMSGPGRAEAWATGGGGGNPSGGGSWKGGGEWKGSNKGREKGGYKGKQDRPAYVGQSSVQEWLNPNRDDDRKGGGKGKGKDNKGGGKGKTQDGSRPAYENRGPPRVYNSHWGGDWKGWGKGKEKGDDYRRSGWQTETRSGGGKDYVPKGRGKGADGKGKGKDGEHSAPRATVEDGLQEDKSRSFTAAGVVFFTRDAEGKVSNLLLGVEERKVKFKEMGEDMPGQSTVKVILFPQGKVQKRDVDFVATAKRELIEETGDQALATTIEKYLPGCSDVPAHFLENAKMMVVFVQVGEDGYSPPPYEVKEGSQMSLFWIPAEVFHGDRKTTSFETPFGSFPLFPVTRKYLMCRQFQVWLTSPTKMLAPVRGPTRAEEQEELQQQQQKEQKEGQKQAAQTEPDNVQEKPGKSSKLAKQGDDTDGQDEPASAGGFQKLLGDNLYVVGGSIAVLTCVAVGIVAARNKNSSGR